jgi:hypothetical protein
VDFPCAVSISIDAVCTPRWAIVHLKSSKRNPDSETLRPASQPRKCAFSMSRIWEVVGAITVGLQQSTDCSTRINETVSQVLCLTERFTTKVLEPRCTKNYAKILSNCDVGAYFEREADSPKFLNTLRAQSKGWKAWNAGSCLPRRCTTRVSAVIKT